MIKLNLMQVNLLAGGSHLLVRQKLGHIMKQGFRFDCLLGANPEVTLPRVLIVF